MSTPYAHTFDTLGLELTAAQRQCFEVDGVLAVRQLLSADQVVAARDAWARIVHRLRDDVARGSATYTPGRDEESNYAGASIRRVGGRANLLFERGVDPFAVSAAQAEPAREDDDRTFVEPDGTPAFCAAAQ